MTVALVAFRGTVAANIVRRLADEYMYFEVGSSRRLIDEFCASDVVRDADYIVAAGVYRGLQSQYVHVEGVCADDSGQYLLDTSLADGELFRKTLTIKNSWCNMLAAGLVKSYPQKRIAFLHIPSRLSKSEVTEQLRSGLRLSQQRFLPHPGL